MKAICTFCARRKLDSFALLCHGMVLVLVTFFLVLVLVPFPVRFQCEFSSKFFKNALQRDVGRKASSGASGRPICTPPLYEHPVATWGVVGGPCAKARSTEHATRVSEKNFKTVINAR
jgi:hypothetical protein